MLEVTGDCKPAFSVAIASSVIALVFSNPSHVLCFVKQVIYVSTSYWFQLLGGQGGWSTSLSGFSYLYISCSRAVKATHDTRGFREENVYTPFAQQLHMM